MLTVIGPLVTKAQQGDRSVLPHVTELLDTYSELWKVAGDLAAHAERSLLGLIAGNDLFAQEATRRKLAAMKTELLGPAPSPLEKLLVERITHCWMAVQYTEMEWMSVLDSDKKSGVVALSNDARKRLDSAHRRYMLAIKQLALVRKLLQPQQAKKGHSHEGRH